MHTINNLEDFWLHLILEDLNLHLSYKILAAVGSVQHFTWCSAGGAVVQEVLRRAPTREACVLGTKDAWLWWSCPNTCGNWRLSYIWHVYPTYLRIYINSLNDDDESLLYVNIHAIDCHASLVICYIELKVVQGNRLGYVRNT